MDVNVSELVTRVLESLGSSAFQQINWISGVRDELQLIRQTLLAIGAVLLDAQNQQSTSESTRLWLQNLKLVAYDIDDALDLVSTQDLELKINGRSLFRRITKLFTDYDVAQEIKALRRRLEEIEYNRKSFAVLEWSNAQAPVSTTEMRETYSHVRGSDVIGREDDRDKIIRVVMSSSSDKADCLSVIPIIGIGGMGKTTLAKLLYNDSGLASCFELRVWVYVSCKFVLRSLILAILQTATGLNFSWLNMELLQSKLRETLEGRTYLLILDDVWIRDPKEWMELKELLSIGSPRSKIIVTTRDEMVASLTGTVEAYNLKGLSDDQCWSIFAKCAFNNGEQDMYPLLAKIGKSIVHKCCGVPLAAKTLGSMLYNQRDGNLWNKINESELWKIEQGSNDILPALKLSYNQISCHLRSCFAFCAVFGKGCSLEKADLVNMWMALQLGQLRGGVEDDDEDTGEMYFNELLSRCFFQLPGYDVAHKVATKYAQVLDEKSCLKLYARLFKKNAYEKTDTYSKRLLQMNDKHNFVEMHDLLHDLAAYVSEDETVILTSCRQAISPRAKYVVWNCDNLSTEKICMNIFKVSKARAFTFLHPMGLLSNFFLKELLSHFKCLRILNLSRSEFEELPETIGGLKHLRYLDLSWNSKLVVLPQSICRLVNLQTLDLCNCIKLKSLPKDIHKLQCLRYFRLTSEVMSLPKDSICKLSSLRMLGIWSCRRLTSSLQGIGCLKNLRILQFVCCDSMTSLPNDMKLLINLKELRIHYCERLDLKGWEGLQGLVSLEYLDFTGLPELIELPDMINSVRRLQILKIGSCESLRAMPEGMQYFTSLLKLVLSRCPRVIALPTEIGTLKHLQELHIIECPHLSQRCERNVGGDWNIICHIPEIYIDGQIIQTEASPIP